MPVDDGGRRVNPVLPVPATGSWRQRQPGPVCQFIAALAAALLFVICRAVVMATTARRPVVRGSLLKSNEFIQCSTFTPPSIVASISRAPGRTFMVIVLPPGQRTHSCVGASGVLSTSTTLSCDQYPLPA